jgi:hypothetical protein
MFYISDQLVLLYVLNTYPEILIDMTMQCVLVAIMYLALPYCAYSSPSQHWGVSKDKEKDKMIKIGGDKKDVATSVTTTSYKSYVVVGYSTSRNRSYSIDSIENNDIFFVKLDQHNRFVWNNMYGGTGNDVARSVIPSDSSGFLITGSTTSDFGEAWSRGNGKEDMFVMRIDNTGTFVWLRTIGGKGNDVAQRTIATSDGGYIVVGSSNSNDGQFDGLCNGEIDGCIVKIDHRGFPVWNRMIGGVGNDVFYSACQTSDGYLFVGKTSSTILPFNASSFGGDDIYIVKTNLKGKPLWIKTYGGSNDDVAFDIVSSSDGDFIVTGRTNSNTGLFHGMALGQHDMFVMKIRPTGELTWVKTIGGSGVDASSAICSRPNGTFVIAGYTSSKDFVAQKSSADDWDIATIQIDTTGTLLSKKILGGMRHEYATSMSIAHDNHVVVCGARQSSDYLAIYPKDLPNKTIQELMYDALLLKVDIEQPSIDK